MRINQFLILHFGSEKLRMIFKFINTLFFHIIKIIFIIIFIITYETAFSQSSLDSLFTQLQNTVQLKQKSALGLKLIDEFLGKNPQFVIKVGRELLDQADIMDDAITVCKAKSAIAQSKVHLGEYNDAKLLAKELITHAIKEGVVRYEAIGHLTLGSSHYYLGEYESAIKEYYRAYELGKRINEFAIQINGLSNVATAYMLLEEFEEVKSIYLQVQKLAREQDMKLELAMSTLNLGVVESKLKNLSVSKQLMKESLILFQEEENKYGEGLALLNLGFVSLQAREYNDALSYNEKSLAIKEDLNDQAGVARLLNNNAIIFLELADWDKAKGYATQAYNLSIAFDRIEDIKIALDTKYKIYLRLNQYDSALYNYQQLDILTDSLMLANNQAEINKILASYEFDQVNQNIDELSKSLAESRNELGVYKWIIIPILIVLVIILSIGFLIYRNNQLKIIRRHETLNANTEKITNKLNHLVKEYEKAQLELTRKARQLEEQEKIQIENLQQITSLVKGETLGENKIKDNFWISFYIYFNALYPTFISSLKASYPNLTQSDIRICSLIRLNLESHDIAQALAISLDSLRKARYRIYKKMNLSSDKELVEFILNLSVSK
ncbi:tetratricopeptide repeat protein [Peijinzhouia sedimentorum]